jgi:type IV pilus assembly protein PilP
MLIGSNNGRISRITSTTVEIVESFRDERGKYQKRTIVLTLAKKR